MNQHCNHRDQGAARRGRWSVEVDQPHEHGHPEERWGSRQVPGCRQGTERAHGEDIKHLEHHQDREAGLRQSGFCNCQESILQFWFFFWCRFFFGFLSRLFGFLGFFFLFSGLLFFFFRFYFLLGLFCCFTCCCFFLCCFWFFFWCRGLFLYIFRLFLRCLYLFFGSFGFFSGSVFFSSADAIMIKVNMNAIIAINIFSWFSPHVIICIIVHYDIDNSIIQWDSVNW